MQAFQESLPDEGQLLKDSVYQLNEPSFEENQQQLQIGKIISNNLDLKSKNKEEQSIDFYGKNQGSTEHQDYGERYESILSHGANQNLQANKNMLNS